MRIGRVWVVFGMSRDIAEWDVSDAEARRVGWVAEEEAKPKAK